MFSRCGLSVKYKKSLDILRSLKEKLLLKKTNVNFQEFRDALKNSNFKYASNDSIKHLENLEQLLIKNNNLQCKNASQIVQLRSIKPSTFSNESNTEVIKKLQEALSLIQLAFMKHLSSKRQESDKPILKRKFSNLFRTDRLFKNKTALFSTAALISTTDPIKNEPIHLASASFEIPDPPPIPEAIKEEAVNVFNALGEPTFVSLGLGGSTPIGWVQSCLEYVHVTLGIPWWQAIVIGTIVIRICMFPLVITAQRNAARMNNYLPQLQVLQLKMTEARQTGNQLDLARYSQEMMGFMKEKGLNPLKNMIVPLAQMPVFVSFFMGLRQMANLPVESLKDGGILWFVDLTVPDQFFLLPVITSFTLWATIELGADSAKLSSQNMQIMKYVLRAMPVIILPFTINFPGVILCYWVSSNFISLVQVGFLKIPKVRTYFNIEAAMKHETLPMKNKGFVGGIKESWSNLKLTRELEERRRFDEMQFQRAGKGPLVKTYKYDPTKQIQAKPKQ